MASTKKVLDIEQIDQRDLQSEITSRLARLIAKSSPGSRLPTERELCELLNVGRNSLREAIKSLAFIGAVQVKRGNGIYVTSAEEANVERLVGLGLLLQRAKIQDIAEARRFIETDIVKLAAERYTREDREKLEANLRELAAHRSSALTTSHLDLEFHAILASASHNSVLIYFVNGMRSLIHAWIDIKLSNASNQQEVTDEILQEHQGILEAVLARDAIIAAERMSEHLMNAARRLEAAIGADYCLTEDVFALLVPRTRSD